MGIKKYLLLLFIAVAASQSLGAEQVSAVGVSPASQVFEDAVANATINGEVSISRSHDLYDEVIKVQGRGDAGDMLSFPDGDLLPFAKGQRSAKVHFTINTGNVATGTYNGLLQASQTQLPGGITLSSDGKFTKEGLEKLSKIMGSGSGNFSSSMMDISIHVTNKLVEKWHIEGHNLQPIEESQPVSYSVLFINDASVAVKPGKSVVEIKKPGSKEYEWKEEHSFSTLKNIPAFTKKDLPIDTAIMLKVGTYLARVTVYNRAGKLVYDSGDRNLEIAPDGRFVQDGEFIKLNSDKDTDDKSPPSYAPGEFATLRGTFKNTGKIGVRARFVVDIYKDGVKIDVVKSDDHYVSIGKEGEFEIPYKFGEKGEYKVVGYFTYGASKTGPREMLAYVGVPPPAPVVAHEKPNMLKGSVGQFGVDPTMWIGLGIIAFLVALFWIIFYRHKKPYPIGAYCLPAQKQIQNSNNNNQH